MPNDPRLLMPSPYDSDGGEMIGRDPRDPSIRPVLEAQDRPKTRGKALRAKCIDCAGGSPSEVRKCTATECALWPFRMGPSPFRKAKGDEDDMPDEDPIDTTETPITEPPPPPAFFGLIDKVSIETSEVPSADPTPVPAFFNPFAPSVLT